MHTLRITSLFLALSVCACLDSDEVPCATDTGTTDTGTTGAMLEPFETLEREDPHAPSQPVDDVWNFDAGTLWAPCRPGEDWGCEGWPGTKLACLRPLSDINLEICAPQTAGVAIDDDCANVPDPGFNSGVVVSDSTVYCIGRCKSDRDCPAGMLCSAFGTCAWHVEP